MKTKKDYSAIRAAADNGLAPSLGFCPYCGSNGLKFVGSVPRCMKCSAVFFVTFSRFTRKSPRGSKL